MIDTSVNIGNVIEVTVIVVGLVSALAMLRATVSRLSTDVSELKDDVKALNKVVVEMAVAHTRLDSIENDIRELRHGRGFIREAIEGEWPKAP